MSTGLDNFPHRDPNYISGDTKGIHQRIILGNLEIAVNGSSLEDIDKWLNVVNKYIDRVETGELKGDKNYMIDVLVEIRRILLPVSPVFGVLDTINNISDAIRFLENSDQQSITLEN